MDQYVLTAACACLAVGLLAVAVLLIRERQITARLRKRTAQLEGNERIRDEELRHLITARLPVLVESLDGRPVKVPGLNRPQLAGTPYDRGLQMVMAMFTESVEWAKARADQSAKATLKAMMRAVQSLTNEQQLAISQMQNRHDNPFVLEDLMKIDHMNAQLGRRAQATAVLCGSWPGQQRSASPLIDVVRGATSRIRDYVRIDVHAQPGVAVVSRVVEPVVLAVAELLDNAARHSQPNTSVQVNFQSAHNGIAVMIDDAGVAMNAEELQRAARLLSGRVSVDINRLGDPPQVGFAVIGVLAARYGFTVSVDTRSPYGGVRAVVFLPTELLTQIENTPEPKPEPALTAPAPAPAPMSGLSGSDAPQQRQVTAGGLPKRQRASAERSTTGEQALPTRQPAAAELSSAPDLPPGRPARETAAGMGAWQRGTRSGRATASPDSEGNLPA
jgi:hypothetical protein